MMIFKIEKASAGASVPAEALTLGWCYCGGNSATDLIAPIRGKVYPKLQPFSASSSRDIRRGQ
jgi:hypothetical protein